MPCSEHKGTPMTISRRSAAGDYAVDTSVLLDVFLADERVGPQSKQRLRGAYDAGALVVCDVAYAEPAPAFGRRMPIFSLERVTIRAPI